MSMSTLTKLYKLYQRSYSYQKSYFGSPDFILNTYVAQSFKKLKPTDSDASFQLEIQCLQNSSINSHQTDEDALIEEYDTRSLADVLLQRLMDKDDSASCLVVLGDSGMGKTTLALSLMQRIWQEDLSRMRLPIYIHLPLEFRHLKDLSLQSFLERNDFSAEELEEILSSKLVIFLDGFDEFHTVGNVVHQIYKQLPNIDAKVVILSRLEELPADRPSRAKLFQPLGSSFDEYVLQPFDSTNIQQYILKYTNTLRDLQLQELKGTIWELAKVSIEGTDWIDNPEKYTTWIDKITEMSSLTQNPFLLSLILLSLPQIVESQDSKQSSVRRVCSTRVGIFDSFTDNWFKFQAQKLVDAKVPFAKFGVSVIQRYFRAYAQNVAHNLIQDNGLLSDNAIQVSTTSDIIFLQPAYDADLLCHYEQHKEFLEKCGATSAVRKGCLAQVRENEFRFFHRSLAEYFAARDLFDGIQGEFDYHVSKLVNLNKHPGLNRQIIKDKQLLLQLAERVNLENDFCETLYKIIRKSSEFSIIALMSSNAITILNLAGKSFSGENFQNVQIPRANLSHSLCGNTDFRGANLSGVKFQESWLVKSKFQGAKLFDVEFGEHPTITCDHIVFRVMVYTMKQRQYLMVGTVPDWTFGSQDEALGIACRFLVTQWNLSTDKLKKTFEHKEGTKFKFHYQICTNDTLVTCGNVVNIFSIKGGYLLKTVTFLDDPFKFAFTDDDLKWICCVEENSFRIHNLEKNFVVGREASYTFTQDRRSDRFPLVIRKIMFVPFSKQFLIQTNNCVKIVAFPRQGLKKMVELSETNFKSISTLAIDPKGQICCIMSFLGIAIMAMSTGNIIEKLTNAHDDQINCAQFMENSTMMATGSDDCSIKIWKYDPVTFRNWELYKHFRGYVSGVISIAFCHENNVSIAVAVSGKKLVKIQTVTGDGYAPFTGEKFMKRSVSTYAISRRLTSDKVYFATLSLANIDYGVIEMFDAENGRITSKFKVSDSELTVLIAVLADDTILLIQRSNQDVFSALIYNDCGEVVLKHIFEDGEQNYNSNSLVLLSNDQNELAVVRKDGNIQLYDILWDLQGSTKSLSCKMKMLLCGKEFDNTENSKVKDISFNEYGNLFASSSWEIKPSSCWNTGIIRIWDIESGQMIHRFESDCYRMGRIFSNCYVACRVQSGKLKFTTIKPVHVSHFVLHTEEIINGFYVIDHLNLVAVTLQYYDGIQSLNAYDLKSLKLILKVPVWFTALNVLMIPCPKKKGFSPPHKVDILLLDEGFYFDGVIACIELQEMTSKCWEWRLVWGSFSKCVLLTEELEMTQAFCLSRQNQSMLTSYGACGKAASEYYPFISRALLLKPLVGTSLSAPVEPLITVKCSKKLTIDFDNWIVTGVVSKKHAFLILEGVLNRRFIVRADLTYNKKWKQICILTNPTTQSNLQKFMTNVNKLKGNQWNVTSEQGMLLLNNIMQDKQKDLGKYKMLTNNCVSWAVSHLESVGLSFPHHWYSSAVTLPSLLLEGRSNDSVQPLHSPELVEIGVLQN